MSEHVQIGDISPRIQYSGDGLVDVFSYPFPIFENMDINVYLNAELQDGGYSVTGAGLSAGGTVRFNQAPAVGTTVTLSRRVPEKRTTDFQDGGAFRAKVINEELDRIVCMVQQIREDVGRSVVRPATSTSGASLALPDPEAGKSLKWSVTGDALVNSNVDPDGLASAVADAEVARDIAQAAAGDAATSETHAAASAFSASHDAAAVASALSNITEDVVSISTDTVLTGAAAGDLYVVDCSASDVIVTLPLAATVIEPWTVHVKKVDGTANKVLVRRQGTDTIDGNITDFEIKAENGGARFAVDLDKAPDNWESLAFGVAVGDATPVGTIMSFDGPIPVDAGCLLADGRSFAQTSFSDLYTHYEAQGFPYGGGNGVANLPNLMAGTQIGDKQARACIYEYTEDGVFAEPTVAGGWQDRTQFLETKFDADGIVSVEANTFTVGPGTYSFRTRTPIILSGGCRTRLFSVTDNASVPGSISESSSTGNPATYYQPASLESTFEATFTVPTVLKLQYIVQVARATAGQGIHDYVNGMREIHASIIIERLRTASTNKTLGIKAYNAVTNQAQVEMGQVVQDVAANATAIAAIPPGIGISQVWKDLTASRVVNAEYTNSTSQPIMLNVQVNMTNTLNYTLLEVGGVPAASQQGSSGGTYTYSLATIVPPNTTYRLIPATTGFVAVYRWLELRA